MPLYRFHLRDAFGVVEDEEGIDLPDLASAFREALRSAREFSREAEPASALRFEITDEAGRVVLNVPLQVRTAAAREAEALGTGSHR